MDERKPMPYQFTTPHVWEGPIGGHRLFEFYQQKQGVSVLRYGNRFVEVRFPSQDELRDADQYWLGGSTYEVDDATASALSAAGYDDSLTEII